MFEYKGFRIERSGKDNLTVSHLEEKPERVGGGAGIGPGTLTGKMVSGWEEIGYYSTFPNALHKVIGMLAEEGKDVQELREILKQIEELSKSIKVEI